MSKPARLYPKPEPVTIDVRLLIIGCSFSAIVFFMIGWSFRNIGVLV